MAHPRKSVKSEVDSLELFRQLTRRKAELIAAEGIRAVPYLSEDLPHFSKLTPEKQKEALHQLSETVAVYEEIRAEGLSLCDNPTLLWRSLSRLKLVPCGDVFDKITKEHLVVIFGLDQRQIFRNLEFLRFSILTLEELYSTEWFRYTRRDSRVTEQLRILTHDIIWGKKSGTFDPEIEEHVIEQVGTAPGPVKLGLKIDYVSTLTADGQLAGIVAIERAWPIEWQS